MGSGEAPDLIQRVQEAAGKAILRYTVPIFAPKEIGKHDDPCLAGSGVLLQIHDDRFLVSAAHSIAFALVPDDLRTITLPAGDKSKPMVQLSGGQVIRSRWEKGDPYHQNDPVDVAAIRLEPADADRIVGEYQFLRLHQLDLDDQFPSKAFYSVVGFPSDSFQKFDKSRELMAPALNWGCRPYHGERGPIPGFDPEIHAALHFTAGVTHGRDLDPKEPPNPKGMSGCGVWRILDNGRTPQGFDASKVRLVAIEWARRTDVKVLRATKIRYVIRMIWNRFPHLQRPIEVTVDTNTWKSISL